MSSISRFPPPQEAIIHGPPIPTSGSLSARMTVYNHARTLARRTGVLEPSRVNRALGILMSPGRRDAKAAEYGTSLWECYCKDSRYRRMGVCKHRLALLIQAQADRIVEDFRRGGGL